MEAAGRVLKMIYKKYPLFVMLLAFCSAAAKAQRPQHSSGMLTFHPGKTQIAFTLGDVLHTVHGTFKLKSGSLHFDPASGAVSGTIIVDATSGDSGSKARDRKMHKEILESDKYPEIAFTPTHVSGSLTSSGDSQVQVAGIFRLHGSDHPIVLTVPVRVAGDEFTVKTHFAVPYVQWGLKNPSTFILRVNDRVDIDLSATAHWTLSETH